MSKEVMKQALEALLNSSSFIFIDASKGHLRQEAIGALKTAIARPAKPTAVGAVEQDDTKLLDFIATAPSGTIRMDNFGDLIPVYIYWSDGVSVRQAIASKEVKL